MKHCNELHNKLAAVFDGLLTGKVSVDEAAEAANLAGKMINIRKTQVAYYELRKEAPTIDFLADDKPAA